MKIEADIFNLTPHPITIDNGTPKVTYQPMEVKELPRVHMKTTRQDEVNGMPIRKIKLSTITHLPEYEDGTLYIVSAMVAQVASHRSDLICPDTEYANRNEKGFIVSVEGFVSYARSPVWHPTGSTHRDGLRAVARTWEVLTPHPPPVRTTVAQPPWAWR